MKIYKYIHSCILLEEQGKGLLFDPGVFSFTHGPADATKFYNLEAIIITHIHSDHLDIEALKTILAANTEAPVITNTEIAASLKEDNIEATIHEAGTLQAGVFTIEALPAQHEAILADALPQNCAYRVNSLVVHPGDSLSSDMAVWQGTPVLLLPIFAPWLTDVAAYAFAQKMHPQTAIPIHDGYVKDFFLQARYTGYGQFLERANIAFKPLAIDDPAFEITQT